MLGFRFTNTHQIFRNVEKATSPVADVMEEERSKSEMRLLWLHQLPNQLVKTFTMCPITQHTNNPATLEEHPHSPIRASGPPSHPPEPNPQPLTGQQLSDLWPQTGNRKQWSHCVFLTISSQLNWLQANTGSEVYLQLSEANRCNNNTWKNKSNQKNYIFDKFHIN